MANDVTSLAPPPEMENFVQCILGKRCWHVSTPELWRPSFSLALGGKIERRRIMPNADDPFSTHYGEAGIYVWGSWRLDGDSGPLASSAQEFQVYSPILQRALSGLEPVAIRIKPPAWDLTISFSGEVRLTVFCHLLAEDSTNWLVHDVSRQLMAGPGYKWEILTLP